MAAAARTSRRRSLFGWSILLNTIAEIEAPRRRWRAEFVINGLDETSSGVGLWRGVVCGQVATPRAGGGMARHQQYVERVHSGEVDLSDDWGFDYSELREGESTL